MNWYHRGEERYVEYGSSFPATRAFGVFRSLQDTVYNMNLAHLSRLAATIFEQLDDAGLRTACTTYLIYRGRFRHDPVRRLALPPPRRGRAVPPRRLGPARALLRRPVRLARHRLLLDARHARPARPPRRLRRRPTSSSTTCSTSCSCRCRTTTATRTSTARTPSRRRSPRPTARSSASSTPRGGLDAFLADHAVIVMSDHSQSRVEQPVNLAHHLGDWRVLAPSDSAPEEAELAVCPGARSAHGLRARPRAGASGCSRS